MLPEKQKSCRKIVLPEDPYNLSGSIQDIYGENHAKEEIELCAVRD